MNFKKPCRMLAATFLLLGGMAAAVAAEPQVTAKDAVVVAANSGDFQSSKISRLNRDWGAFWSNGSGTVRFTVDADLPVRVAVEAYGTPAMNEWPVVQLSVDGKPVFIWRVDAPQGKPAWYVSPLLRLKSGAHTVSLDYNNDMQSAGTNEDRNLFLGRIVIGAVTAPAALPDATLLAAGGRPVVQEGSLPKVVPAEKPAPPVPVYHSPAMSVSALAAIKLPCGASVRPGDYRIVQRLAGNWKLSPLVASAQPFAADPEEEQRFSNPAFDASAWEEIPVPLNWYVRHRELYPSSDKATRKPYVKGWYRAKLSIPAHRAGTRVILRFEEIGYEATLWINGQRVGSHEGDFTPAVFDITEALGGKNEATLAMRVLTDFGTNGGVPRAKHVYGSQWSHDNIKGGIWGEASLSVEPPVYISRALVTPRLAASSVELALQITNTTDKAVRCRPEAVIESALRAARGVKPVAAAGQAFVAKPGVSEVLLTVPLKAPRLWSLEDPYLYYAHVALANGKRVLDLRTERFGFRDFKIKDRQFYLNGKRIYLYGENLPSVGYGGNGKDERDGIVQRLLNFKKNGYVMLRTPHMPIIPQVLDLADELGIMIFDEWGWSFTDQLDPEQFESHNLREVEEWVMRDYNHACVTMWSGGNEVHYGDPLVREQFNKEVARIRSLDRSRRPISVFDGSGVGYGKLPLDTDVYCVHDYMGLASRAWTFMPEQIAGDLKTVAGIYGKLDKPVIFWECVGFSWGGAPERRTPDQPLPLDTYLRWCQQPTSWGSPGFSGGVGMMGMRSWIDPQWGLLWGREVMGKRILEALRVSDQHVQGWAPWFQEPNVNSAVWNAPLQCFSLDLTQHPLPGGTIRATLRLRNDQDAAAKDVRVELRLLRMPPEAGAFRKSGYREPAQEWAGNPAEAKAAVVARWTAPVGTLAPFAGKDVPFSAAVPAGIPAGDYRLLLTTSGTVNARQTVAHNYYEMTIWNVPEPVAAPAGKVLVLDTPAIPAAPTERVLKDLNIPFTTVKDLSELPSAKVLIVPAQEEETTQKTPVALESVAGSGLVAPWVASGGTLVVLEQLGVRPLPFLHSLQIVPRNANTLVDLAVPDHPAFAGMKQRHLDGWDGGDHRLIARCSLTPLTENVIATTGHYLGGSGVLAALVDARAGKGRLIASQLDAVSRWKQDSCATRYLANLLREAMAPKPWSGVRELVTPPSLFLPGGREQFFVDLQPFANRGLKDDVAEDGKGGWTDQGAVDLRSLPTGKHVFQGVPFQICGGDNAALILRGKDRPNFPAQITGIPVQRKVSKLFFLHTAAWGHAGNPGKYVIRYADGASVDIPLEIGVNISDWWNACDLTKATVAWTAPLKEAGWVGLFQFPWENPREDVAITSIDFVSGGGAVPALLAITGLAANPNRLVVTNFENDKPDWACIVDPATASLPKPQFTRMAQDGIQGGYGRIAFPAGSEGAKGVAFVHFNAQALRADSHRIFTFWVKSSSDTALTFVLPEKDWKDSLRWTVPVQAGGWSKVSLDLAAALKEHKLDISQLRGEFFIFNEVGNRDNPAVTLDLDEVQFE